MVHVGQIILWIPITIFKLMVSQLIAVVALPVIFIIFVVNHVLIRNCLALYLLVRYRGKVKLVEDSGDAMFGYESNGNTRNILIAIQMDNIPDVREYTDKFEQNVIHRKVGNKRPYEKLKWIFTNYCGYFSWKFDDNFNINNHLRIIDEDKVTPDRLREILAECRKDMNPDHPQWQFNFIPHFINEDGLETCSVIVRFHHAILDGISFVLFVSHCLGVVAPESLHDTAGQPSHDTFPYILNPLTFKVPLKYRIINNINCLLFGFYHLMRTLMSTSKHWTSQNKYPGDTKNYDWSNNIDSSTLKIIRKSCKVSVPSIISSCLLQAFENVVDSRIPENVTIGHSLAFLPYPDPFFNNRFTLLSVSIQRSHQGTRRDKVKVYHRQNMLALQGPEPSLYYWFFQFYGKLPAPFFKFVLKQPRFSFFLNNLPFSKKQLFIWNSRVLSVKGWPPYTTDAGIGVTSVGYCDKICAGVTADSSWLTKDELRLTMTEFDKEINLLAKECALDQA